MDLDAILAETNAYKRIAQRTDAVDTLVVTDQSKATFLALVNNLDRIYRAILPDVKATQYYPIRTLLVALAEEIRSLAPEVDISEVMDDVEDLLDRSIATPGYVIRGSAPPTVEEDIADYHTDQAPHLVDLSQIDIEALKEHFKGSRKRIEVEKLRGAIHTKLKKMIRLNRQRLDYMQQFQRLIDEYNAGSRNVEQFFQDLISEL